MASGTTYTKGDYYATLPGAYVEHLNPALWQSPDLDNIQGRAPTYLRGPSQYLTLYPMAWLDSYAEIAAVLLGVYAVVIFAAAFVMWRALSDAAGRAAPAAGVVAATLMFFPLLQAYVAREFEVVTVLALALALWAMVRDRQAAAGAWLAYLALFKYLPLIALPYLALRRWWRALAGFAVSAGVLLALAHWLFGLQHFTNNHIPNVAAGLVSSLGTTQDFCDGPDRLHRFSDAMQETNLRFALCGVGRVLPVPPVAAYLAIVLATIAAAGLGFVRLERSPQPLAPAAERWRRVWELSLLVIVYSTFFYSHYYYLCVLIVPLNALLVRAWPAPVFRPWPLGLWMAAYLLLAAFALPPSFLSRVLGTDVWWLYMRSQAYFAGEMLLLGLVLREYLTVEVRSEK
jgi:hypothetical protein